MNPKDNEFKKLQKQWYKNLKKSGFSDIENPLKGEFYLNTFTTTKLNHYRKYYGDQATYQEIIGIKTEYYRQITFFLNDYKEFETEQDLQIWQMHTEGLSYRQIALQLKSINKDRVNKIIAKYKQKMIEFYRAQNHD